MEELRSVQSRFCDIKFSDNLAFSDNLRFREIKSSDNQQFLGYFVEDHFSSYYILHLMTFSRRFSDSFWADQIYD